jgi:hypothetical protein
MNSAISSEVLGDAPRLCETADRAGQRRPGAGADPAKAREKAQASRVTSTVTFIATLGAPW